MTVQWFYAFNISYACSFLLYKLAIVLFYYRTFPSEGFRKVLRVFLIFMLAVWAAHFLAMVFICTPISFFWDNSVAGGYCIDEYALFMSASAWTIVFDVGVLVLPTRVVWNMRVSRSEKITLTGIFILGSL